MVTTEPINIYITAKDIREGERGSGSKCIVARALRRAFLREHPEARDAEIDVTVIAALVVQVLRPNRQAEVHWWVSSPTLQFVITKFDNGLDLKPGTYRLKPGKVRE